MTSKSLHSPSNAKFADSETFYAGGNRISGTASSSTSGANPKNEAIVKGVALAESWDMRVDLTGWALSEKLDGMRCVRAKAQT